MRRSFRSLRQRLCISNIHRRRWRLTFPLRGILPGRLSRFPNGPESCPPVLVNCLAPTAGQPALLRELGPSNVPPAWRRSTLTISAAAPCGLALLPTNLGHELPSTVARLFLEISVFCVEKDVGSRSPEEVGRSTRVHLIWRTIDPASYHAPVSLYFLTPQ